MLSKKHRYQAIKQKEQSKLKIQMTTQLHEIRRHKWQDTMNLYNAATVMMSPVSYQGMKCAYDNNTMAFGCH